jgi:hypothetical protein
MFENTIKKLKFIKDIKFERKNPLYIAEKPKDKLNYLLYYDLKWFRHVLIPLNLALLFYLL